MKTNNPIDLYEDKAFALDKLSELLRCGSLCLFLGAGVSQSSGDFPGWHQLVSSCAQDKGVDIASLADDAVALLKVMDEVRHKCSSPEEYKELVRNHLTKDFEFTYRHAQNLLLISIGALLMGSSRGSIDEVITYNFDDFLEWYLSIHGYRTQVVTDLPFTYERSDVRVFHPHGFLPKSSNYTKSRELIFDSLAYDLHIGNEASPWFALSKHILLQKVAVMIGLSGSDPAITVLVARVCKELRNNGNTRPVAFFLNTHKYVDENKMEWYRDRGIVPLEFNDYDQIWQYLLSICRRAAGQF